MKRTPVKKGLTAFRVPILLVVDYHGRGAPDSRFMGFVRESGDSCYTPTPTP